MILYDQRDKSHNCPVYCRTCLQGPLWIQGDKVGGNEKNKKHNKTPQKNQTQNENVKFSLFFWKHKRQLSIIGGRDGDDSGGRIQFSMNCNNKAKINFNHWFWFPLLLFTRYPSPAEKSCRITKRNSSFSSTLQFLKCIHNSTDPRQL